MKFDWTVPVWNLIVAAVFLGSILHKLGGMESKLNTLWDIFISETKANGTRKYDNIFGQKK